MLAAGVKAHKLSSLRFRYGGSLTWAAKPSVRESPNPASNFFRDQSHPCFGPLPTLAIRLFRAASSFAIQYGWTN